MSHERYLPMTLPNKLAQLAEEAGEVVAAVGKTLRFGLDSENPELPDGIREKNRVWLTRQASQCHFLANRNRHIQSPIR
jgi:hypothetical protein